MNEISITTICNAGSGEGVLATGKVFTLAGWDHPLLNRCTAASRISAGR
ncbi:MAG: hypothetical protein NT082_06570 [Chloroflexi bacterium]|nr:hypothetical protein [Chloroflexota bacterium]